MDDATATPPRRRGRLGWLTGRVEVAEIMEAAAGDPAAAPGWRRPPLVRGVLGGPAQRRRQALPAPPRRERPPDVVGAYAAGEALYGQARGELPPTVTRTLVAAASPADVTGPLLTYHAPEDRRARAVWAWTRAEVDTGADPVRVLFLIRAGREARIVESSSSFSTNDLVIGLEPGDALEWRIMVAGAAGYVLTAGLTIEEERRGRER